jgi:hypothetical protein
MDSLQRGLKQVKVSNAAMTAFSIPRFTGVLEARDFSQAKKVVDLGGTRLSYANHASRKNSAVTAMLTLQMSPGRRDAHTVSAFAGPRISAGRQSLRLPSIWPDWILRCAGKTAMAISPLRVCGSSLSSDSRA